MGFKFGDEILRVSGVEREKKEGFFYSLYTCTNTNNTNTPLFKMLCYHMDSQIYISLLI